MTPVIGTVNAIPLPFLTVLNFSSRRLRIALYSIEQKRERKLVDEIRSQNDYTERIYWDMKTQRDNFVKKINEKYGLDIEVIETRELMMERTIQEVEDRAIAQKAGDNNDTSNSEG